MKKVVGALNMKKVVGAFFFATAVVGTPAFSEESQNVPAGDDVIVECEKRFDSEIHGIVFSLRIGHNSRATHFTLQGSTPAGSLDLKDKVIESFVYNTDLQNWGTYVLVEYFNFSDSFDEPFRGPEISVVNGAFKGFVFEDGDHRYYSFQEADCQVTNVEAFPEMLKN